MVNFAAILNQAILHKKSVCNVKLTKNNIEMLKILYNNGFIYSYVVNNKQLKIMVVFNIIADQFNIKKIKIISKPSQPVYYTILELKNKIVKEGRFYIVSTNIGIISSETALKQNISGEIWIEIIR